MNIDEAMSSNHKKVLAILVSYFDQSCSMVVIEHLLAPAVTVGERRELWILPPFFLASSFAYNFVRK